MFLETTTALKAAKNALRKEIRAKVKAMSDVEKAVQSSQVTQKLLNHPSYLKAERWPTKPARYQVIRVQSKRFSGEEF